MSDKLTAENAAMDRRIEKPIVGAAFPYDDIHQ